MNSTISSRAAAALGFLLLPIIGAYAAPAPAVGDLVSLSLEELLSVEVTSVSRKSQSIAETAASVHVISNEDILRSGARSVPELLRYVPGLHVAQIDSSRWAITARGNNKRFGNKLLVLMDGRTLYSPLFAGVLWNTLDTDLTNIERIEVIRGPGATLWGANAANGVINIITKSARETLGTELRGGLHDESSGFGQIVHGGEVGDDTQYRVFAKYFDRPHTEMLDGSSHADRWRQTRLGFRLDSGMPGGAQARVSGEFYTGSGDTSVAVPIPTDPYVSQVHMPQSNRGSHLLLSWSRPMADNHGFSGQVYFDRSKSTAEFLAFDFSTVDIDLQHQWTVSDSTEVVWGLGYRVDSDDITETAYIAADPASRSFALLSGFVQAEWMLVPDRWSVSIGTKVEDNEFSGFEWQPSIRTAWMPDEDATLWAALSRAVRTPSRGEQDALLFAGYFGPMDGLNPLPVPAELRVGTNRNFGSEDALSWELGYRGQVGSSLSFDVSLFYTRYRSLGGVGLKSLTCQSGADATTLPPCYLVEPSAVIELMVVNANGGTGRGAEVALEWQVSPGSRLELGANWLEETYSDADPAISLSRDRYPSYQLFASWSGRIGDKLLFDLRARSVDRLNNHEIDGYTTSDVRLEYRFSDDLQLAIAGRNLGNGDYMEFQSELREIVPARVSPSAHVELTWRF